jgi:hypothetical protein
LSKDRLSSAHRKVGLIEDLQMAKDVAILQQETWSFRKKVQILREVKRCVRGQYGKTSKVIVSSWNGIVAQTYQKRGANK